MSCSENSLASDAVMVWPSIRASGTPSRRELAGNSRVKRSSVAPSPVMVNRSPPWPAGCTWRAPNSRRANSLASTCHCSGLSSASATPEPSAAACDSSMV